MGHVTPPGSDDPQMVLDPACARLVSALEAPPQLHQLGARDGREALRELQDDRIEGPGVVVEFHTAPVGPSGLVGFTVVRPRDSAGPLPVVMHLHGGRWITGDPDTHGRLIRALAIDVDAVVVVPQFTRVPEARYPIAVEESYATLLWLEEYGADLDLDPHRVALSGDCSGATMAAVLALMSGWRAGPRLTAQLLLYPWMDSRCDSQSYRQFASIPVLSAAAGRWYWSQYAGRPADHQDPAFSPARASHDDLVGLPPAMVVTAEADVMRDEAEDYARRLRDAGNDVTVTRYLGVVHDFITLRPLQDMPAAQAALVQATAFLRHHLDSGRAGP